MRAAFRAVIDEQVGPAGWPVFVAAIASGIVAGAVAQILRQINDPLMDLGGGTAVWLSIGFLAAQTAACARSLRPGIWRAALAMALFLAFWLLTYCLVFGLRDTAGFTAMFRDERPFEIATLPASAVIGLIAALSVRPGLLGSACLAAPVAWSVPEVLRSVVADSSEYWVLNAGRWQFALAVGLPTLLVAFVPMVRARKRVAWLVFAAVAVLFGGAAYLGLRLLHRDLP